MPIVQKLPIRPVLYSLFFTLAWGLPSQAMPKNQPKASSTCNPLGRVDQVQGYSSIRPGQLICAGQKLHSTATAMLDLFCFDTLKNVTFSGATQKLDRKCKSRPIQPRQKCNGTGDHTQCSRGPSSQLALVQPFGNTITESRPPLQWKPIQGATHYKIVVSGFDSSWQETVRGNRLSYPKDQPGLKYGDKYQVTFFVYRQNELLTTQRSSLLLLSEEKVKLIQQGVDRLRQMPLTQTELAKDLDHIYITRNLLNKAIESLRHISSKDTVTPEIRHLLAQRLEEAGHPELADPIRAEAQLPTKVKAPQ